MEVKMKRIILAAVFGLVMVISLYAQQAIKEQLFGDIENLIKKAKAEEVNVLSPSTFDKGFEKYQDALDDFNKGGNLDKIRSKISEAEKYIKKAFEFADLAKLSFGQAIKSRHDALAANADKLATKLWKKAEDKFRDAMEEMEDNDLKSAKEKAGDAEKLYREAELMAIENNLLNPVRVLLKKAKKMDAHKYAPWTYKRAKLYIDSTIIDLQANRYEKVKSKYYASMAMYEASHAIYLTKIIKKLRKRDNAIEEALLMGEAPLKEIANKLSAKVRFDNGLSEPLQIINKRLDSLFAEQSNCLQTLKLKENIIADLNQQIKTMKARLGKYTAKEEKLQKTIALKEEQEAKIKKIARTITPKEGRVLIEGDHVLLRLYGLSFPSGTAIIKPENFGLLKKVQDAIREFNNCKVIVEGHTDSRGSSEINQKLSQERANAVMEYLIANMGIPRDRIQAKGYGESRPVATNKTPEGRAKNRRIDIVIIPEWAE